MMFINKTWHKIIMILIFFVSLFIACTSDEPLTPEALTFREQMLTDFNLLTSRILPVLGTDTQVESAGEIIEKFLLELKRNDQRIFGIGLLDKKGEYLTGFVIDNKTTGKLIKDKFKDMNFHSFKVVEQIANSRRIMQEKLYLQDYGILAIGFPVIKEDEMMGILCFTFKSHEFEKKWRISEEDFLKIDFGKA